MQNLTYYCVTSCERIKLSYTRITPSVVLKYYYDIYYVVPKRLLCRTSMFPRTRVISSFIYHYWISLSEMWFSMKEWTSFYNRVRSIPCFSSQSCISNQCEHIEFDLDGKAYLWRHSYFNRYSGNIFSRFPWRNVSCVLHAYRYYMDIQSYL